MSRITQGVGERPVIAKDEPQIEHWVAQEAKPLLKQLRQAVNELDAAAADPATPTGPAGGQLGGTYPDPDVRGIRETGGPTELAIGAIADGEFLMRSGATVVGGTPAGGGSPGVTLRGFRSRDQGGAFVSQSTRINVAGLINLNSVAGALSFTGRTVDLMQGIGAGPMAYAVPEYFERPGIVNRLITRIGGIVMGGAAEARIGVYANGELASGALTGSPYPGALLGESAVLDLWNGGVTQVARETSGLSIPVSGYVWFVMMFNAAGVGSKPSVPALAADRLFPFLGFTFFAPGGFINDDPPTAGVGWRHGVTFGTTESCPDPFPQTTPVVLVNGPDIPLIGFGFQADP